MYSDLYEFQFAGWGLQGSIYNEDIIIGVATRILIHKHCSDWEQFN